MAYSAHRQSSDTIVARCAVITLSDTRTEETDTSGRTIRNLLTDAAHDVVESKIIPDEPAQLDALVNSLIAREEIDAVFTNGGTGVSRRDQTIEVIARIIERPLPGFGELFRMLSYEQIGSGAMLSRAIGGSARGKLIFAMPGSTGAVELAMTKLILPEMKHLIFELRK